MDKTVLIVEDEFVIAMHLKAVLERNGWRVIGPVGSVAAALHLITIELPTVALLDVELGDELVTPVAAVLKARNVPFALESARENTLFFGDQLLAEAPNLGKMAADADILRVLEELTAAS